MNAWNDETVNTPSLFRVFLVVLDTCVSKDCKKALRLSFINQNCVSECDFIYCLSVDIESSTFPPGCVRKQNRQKDLQKSKVREEHIA